MTEDLEQLAKFEQAGNKDKYIKKTSITNFYTIGSTLMGENWLWWLFPITPILHIDFFEKPVLQDKKDEKDEIFTELKYDNAEVIYKMSKRHAKEDKQLLFFMIFFMTLFIWFFYAWGFKVIMDWL